MIIPGRVVIIRKILHGLLSPQHQIQPCGIDLSLKRVLTWTSAGTIDFDNSHRQTAQTLELPFKQIPRHGWQNGDQTRPKENEQIHLEPGSYLVEFNETVDTPLDVMGQIYVRSSLFRSGALVSAGVMDAGYKGAIGAALQVVNPYGITLHRNAKLAQFVFHQMTEKVDGYSGVYQGRSSI